MKENGEKKLKHQKKSMIKENEGKWGEKIGTLEKKHQ